MRDAPLVGMSTVIVATPETHRAIVAARIARVFDYLFGILYSLLLVRFALELFNARRDADFFRIIAGLTEPFYAPFRGLFAATDFEGAHIVWPLLVAIAVYALIHAAIRGLIGLIAVDRTARIVD